MKCRNCGADLKESVKFCSRCGTKVEQQAAGEPAVQKPAGVPPTQRTGLPPAARKPAAPPAAQRPAAPPAAQRPAVPPASLKPAGTSEQKKSPVRMLVLVVVFLLAGVLVGAIAWKFQEKLFYSGSETEASAKREKSPKDEAAEEKESEPEDEAGEEPEGEAAEAAAPTGTEPAAAPIETEVPTAPVETEMPTMPVETEAPTEAALTSHRYEIVVKDCTWTEAYEEAKNRGGSLVRFETEEEYEHVKNEILSDRSLRNLKLWIGGARSSASREYHWANPDGTFSQEVLNSEAYTSVWMRNEPSFRDEGINQDEYFMNLFYYDSESRWVWNDVPNDIIAAVSSYSGDVGYICEYEE